MLKSARIRLVIVILLLASTSFYWGLFGTHQKPITQLSEDPNRIDFFIRDAFITVFNEQGSIAHHVESPLLQHLPAPEWTLLELPVITRPNDAGFLQISSDHAKMLDDDSEIELAGNVKVIDNSLSDSPWILTTSILTFLPPENYAQTAAPVLIVQGKQRTDAIGMKAWFSEHQVDLLSEVSGYYVPN